MPTMKPSGTDNKLSVDGGGGTTAAFLRPSRIGYLVMLSTIFWGLIFYFSLSMQGNVSSILLLKRSVFSSLPPALRFGEQDRCAGRYIYMYDLPPRFNVDLVRDCRKHSVSTDMCKYVLNGGFGPRLDGDGVSLPEKGTYDTDQYMLAMIYHARMRRYECLTSDPAAATAVFVPFYAGFDASINIWKSDMSARDALSLDMADWLVRRPEWRTMGGRDHFLVLGRPSWDLLRGEDGGWGNAFMTYPAVKNMTLLTVEASPWHGNDFAVPFPSHFHPSSDAGILRWQDRVRRLERKRLWGFAGYPRPGNTTVRGQIIEQCSRSSRCALLDRPPAGSKNSTARIMQLLESADFCLQPRGDTYTRKSTFDTILAGCIPVFFHPASAYLQYTWHLPRDYRSYSVFIPLDHVAHRNASIEETLRKIPRQKVARMREEVIRLIPTVMYNDPIAAARMVLFKDAFDVAVETVIDRVTKRRSAAAEGREYVDGVDGQYSWKYDLGEEDGKKNVGPHEFDPYMV